MSRAVVFGLDNFSVGEFDAIFSRGWALAGSKSTSGGASTTIPIPAEIAEQPWLQFGRMVLVEDSRLPPWAGIIDVPWEATLPVKITVYDAAYLLASRVPDTVLDLTGDFASIVGQMLSVANAQGETYVRPGTVMAPNTQVVKRIEQRPLWEQLHNFGIEQNVELVLRPEKKSNRLELYLDMSSQFGSDVDYELHDGADGNCRIVSAKADGPIYNRVIGISSQSSSESRLTTAPMTDGESANTYGVRSWVEQFRDIAIQSALDDAAWKFLAYHKQPRLTLNIEVRESAFPVMRLGNRIPLHAARLWLPGGRRGWKGIVRVLAMDYNEDRATIISTVEAKL